MPVCKGWAFSAHPSDPWPTQQKRPAEAGRNAALLVANLTGFSLGAASVVLGRKETSPAGFPSSSLQWGEGGVLPEGWLAA